METDYSAQVALFCSVELALLLINYYVFIFAARFYPNGRMATDIGQAYTDGIVYLRRSVAKDHVPGVGIIDAVLILISPPFIFTLTVIFLFVSLVAHAMVAATE